MGRGPDHDHTILAISELVLKDYASSDKTTEVFLTISVAPMECSHWGSSPNGHAKHTIDCLEVHLTICAQNGIREEIFRKVTDSWTKGTKQNCQQMFE